MQPIKVLIIDDSTLIHKMFDAFLPKTVLVHALDGREALTRLAEHPDIDLMIMDINMPNMNGLELLRQVKSDAALASVPVIIISSEGKEEDTLRGLRGGAAAYLKKPFRPQQIVELIAKVEGPARNVPG